VRGRGNTGAVACCRTFLRRDVDLADFGTRDPRLFARALDRSTTQLRSALPKGAQHWGIARKVLNIFLRDSLYNSYLSRRYSLSQAEALFELPLDSFTAAGLRASSEQHLSRWRGVRYVTPALNKEYQLAAMLVANQKGFARVHLDSLWWSADRDDISKNTKGSRRRERHNKAGRR
jgi:hypothetical protein